MKPARWLAGYPVLFVLVIAVGGYLRFHALGEPSYWLDEILHQGLTDVASTKPWWQWFGRIHQEHAGLYYLTQLATRVFGRSEFAGRLASAVFGLATIPLLWFVPSDRKESVAAAVLLAVSPLHVYYSREARGYALLLLLTAALVFILMRGRSIAGACVVLLAMLYSSAVASTVVASAGLVALVLSFLDGERRRWYASVSVLAFTTLALFRLVYAARPAADPNWPGFPRLDWQFASLLARMFSVTALGSPSGGRAALAMLILAIIGAVSVVRRDRLQGIVLIGMTIFPLGITLVALRFFNHFFSVRYVMAALIGYVLLTAAGIASIAGLVPLRASGALALAIAVAIAEQGWSAAEREPFQKLDWRAIAETLRRHVRPGDVIATAEPYSYVSLNHYLRVPPTVHFVLLDLVPVGEKWVRTAPAVWLVNAGYSTPVSQWMCRYPLILASPLEGFQLRYAPSARRFLAMRSLPREQRAVSTALGLRGFTLDLGPEDEPFLGDGWAGAEVSRWAVGLRATLSFPRGPRRDRVIRFHAYPLTHPGLPAQTMLVTLNGSPIANLTLAPEWRDYEIEASASLWTEGMNDLTFTFGRATAPATVDPSSSDRRELSTAFDRFSVDEVGFHSDFDNARIVTLQADADRFLDERTAWRNTQTHLPASRLRRAAVETLLARLGFDPMTTWPRIASGEVRLDNVVETVASGGECEDHESFLRRAFRVLLRRSPSEAEQKDLLSRLTKDPSRDVIVGRIAKSNEFRGQVLAR